MSGTGETSGGSTLSGSTSPLSPGSTSTPNTTSSNTTTTTANSNNNPFAVFNQPSALQHQSTHLNYTASPSLTGELLRQALSEFLRTQICDVVQAVCLYGFNNHDLNPAEGVIPIQMGKLCYAVITQSELILIDRKCIGMLSTSVTSPSYEEIMKTTSPLRSQMVFCVPFHVIREIRIDSEREDYFQLELRPDRGPGFPNCFVLSSVHRKNLCEALTCMYNAHFLFAAMMPDPGAALSASAQAALLAHAQVAASPQIYSTQGRDTDASAQDPLLKSGVLSLHRLIPQNQFSVLTTSSNHTSTIGRIRKLKVVFEDTRSPFKHPAEQFYAALPSKYRGHIFHRCGYMFETKRFVASAGRVANPPPQQSSSSGADGENGTPNLQPLEEEVGEWADQAALFLNRPTATYRFQSPSDIEKNIPLPRRKYLMVSFCPERAISSFSNVVKSRDLRGHVVGRAQGKATLRELLKGRDDCDDDDFFMWAESVGRSVAMNECRSVGNNEYFVPQSLVHTKKCNVVGDKSSWMCFKIHIYTVEREIGVIACRRKCLPPYFDTFQDVVFVLYGACAPINQPLQPRPGFMNELEMMVDTLSPSVVPLPFHYGKGLDLKVIHPTYADILVSQGRVNALLNNSMAYDWLATRAWVQSARGEHGIFPTTEFLGSPCFRLAKSFANSILVRVTHRRERVVWAEYLPVAIEGIGMDNADGDDGAGAEGGGKGASGGGGAGGEEQKYNGEGGEKKEGAGGGGEGEDGDEPTAPKQPLVADPMVIVSRMLTEFAAVEAVSRKKTGPQTSTYSAEEEWRCRVSQYLAYCVDDGIFPGALNIKRLLSVLTRAFLDAPILSAETSMKLDRVVDFLLYLKRRCGSVVELPSAKHALASVAASRGKGKHAGKRNLKQATAETVGSTSPFASLAAESPMASFIEGDPSAYDYDEQSTLLQKLRDHTLLENFTCNEHIMIPLLDTSYIESLEKATIGTAMYQEGTVIPALLASLLTKDYNIDLIRAVRDKIISYEIHHEILIPPLIALMKDGTMQTSQYALHALTMLARFHPRAVVDAGGASLPVWFVFMSKNELLLSASIDLILILFSDETRHLFAQPLFAMKLVDLLRKRVGGARYQNVVLQKTASLMFKLAKIPELLHIFLSTYAHRELVAIIGEHEKKHPILLEITVCLAQLFVFAKNKMLGTPSENAKEDASIIVSTMAYYTTRSQLRICLNMLVALQILIRLPKAYYARLSNTMNNRSGGVQFTAPDKSFETRILVLQHLHTRVGLENVLDRAYASADAEVRRCEELLKQTGAISVNANGEKVVSPPEGDTSDPLSAAARELETIEQRKIAINVKRNARWFKTRMNYAVSANWNVNIIWQKDNSKNFLAGFKD